MHLFLEPHLDDIEEPANLRINDQITRLRDLCRRQGCARPYHHFAFGQSPFPPPPTVVQALAAHAEKHHYLPTAGLPALRDAVAAYYRHTFGIDVASEQVIISPGSKEMIAVILTVLQGTVIIPTPAWVSYLPQATMLKKDVIAVRTRPAEGYRLTPELLCQTLRHVAAQQKVLILNYPHNPTGVVYTEDQLRALVDICRKEQVVVVADEIYAQTTFPTHRFTSIQRLYPEGTIVTGGLSKDRSSGGYRLGVGLFPKEPARLLADVKKVAGATYSCVAAPLQYAALEAYAGSAAVEGYIHDCWALNAAVGRRVATLMNAIPGLRSTVPAGGFYLYVDCNDFRAQFTRFGFTTCADFGTHLLQVEHTAVLPGEALLLPTDDFSIRCSFVDYDGAQALSAWRATRPQTRAQQDAFVDQYCPLVIEGIGAMARYFDQVQRGQKPVHMPLKAARAGERPGGDTNTEFQVNSHAPQQKRWFHAFFRPRAKDA